MKYTYEELAKMGTHWLLDPTIIAGKMMALSAVNEAGKILQTMRSSRVP